MSRIALAVLFSLVSLVGASAEALKETVPHISVTGAASEEVAPDQATLFVGVMTERPTAAEAANDNAQKTRAILDDLIRQGVEAKDIRTEGFTLVPVVSEELTARGAAAKRVTKSFRARNELSVLVKSVDKVGSILQRAVDSGSNEVHGVAFAIGDEAARLEKLRVAAIKDAEQRARAYVEALGLKLGRVIEINPETDMAPGALNFRTNALVEAPRDAPASLPLRPGPKKLTAKVSVTWALSR